MPNWELRVGDWVERLRELPDESVHCCVTSPPYHGLRDYQVAGQLGLEPTLDEYIDKLVAGFRELRRVLRSDGTLWLNLGDSYTSGGRTTHGTRIGYKQESNAGCLTVSEKRPGMPPGLKPKDLIGIPWQVAFALRADGWYLRQDIIWNKKNPMPESVGDRCTKAHEYVFLLSKSERYFFDQEAIKEPSSLFTHSRGKGVNPKCRKHGQHSRMAVDRDPRHLKSVTNGVGWGYDKGEPRAKSPRIRQNEPFSAAVAGDIVSHRNKRSVWTLATEAFKEAHFATFPRKLIEPCILAGTSEKGCCVHCGAPFERQTETETHFEGGSGRAAEKRTPSGWHQSGSLRHAPGDQRYAMRHDGGKNAAEKSGAHSSQAASGAYDIRMGPVNNTRTVGWDPTCQCFNSPLFPRPIETVPCTVLDPFAGAGTTGVVAEKLGRKSILIELSPEYAEIIERRFAISTK